LIDKRTMPEITGRSAGRQVFSAPPLLRPWQMAVFVLAVWALLRLIEATADENSEDGLLVLGIWVLGLGGIVFLPTWQEVVIDTGTQQVHERLGWWRWARTRSSPWADFEAVAVLRSTKRHQEATGAPGTTFSTLRIRRETDYSLRLCRPSPFHDVDLPLPRGATREQTEAFAAELAALGGWALRRLDKVTDAL
jgi:hypothetical protein